MDCDESNRIEHSPDNVTRIPPPADGQTLCLTVQSGDTVILPFDLSSVPSGESDIGFREVDGFLVIEDHNATVVLEGYIDATSVHGLDSVAVENVHGAIVDVATWIASTDPSLDIVQ